MATYTKQGLFPRMQRDRFAGLKSVTKDVKFPRSQGTGKVEPMGTRDDLKGPGAGMYPRTTAAPMKMMNKVVKTMVKKATPLYGRKGAL